MRIVISSGHGKYVRGASGYIDEVDEARRVVDKTATILLQAGHQVKIFHDNTSKDKNTNLKTIVNYHNSQSRDLDVSVHFNANATTSAPVGTECWYYSQVALAGEVSKQIAIAGSLKNRGPKKSTSFYFLIHTTAPSILVEVCFVDSRADSDLYKLHFDAICQALAGALVGQEALPEPPPTGPDIEGRPTLSRGDTGSDVVYLQEQLNSDNRAGLSADGIFGTLTDDAVRVYQASRRLSVDGIVGPMTWEALETDMPPYSPPGLPAPLTTEQVNRIVTIANNSEVPNYSWRDRGKAPIGYVRGVALAFADCYMRYIHGWEPAVSMALANTGNADKDALAWYASIFANKGMDNSQHGTDTLRHVWTLLVGLGLRESSGKYCTGRDQSASNTTSDTCEAGAWQTSWNVNNSVSGVRQEFDTYAAGGGVNPAGFVEQFKVGVTCSSADWQNYGSGNGLKHQQMSKEQPSYAAQVCGLTLRQLRQHYGPINRKEAEVTTQVDDMLFDVQEYLDTLEVAMDAKSAMSPRRTGA